MCVCVCSVTVSEKYLQSLCLDIRVNKTGEDLGGFFFSLLFFLPPSFP